MDRTLVTWLVVNARSGSCTPEALAGLEDHFEAHGFTVAHTVRFPDEDLPTPEALDAADVGMLAVFSGDGTLNAAITDLYGWGGSIVVLPGGTMNLLSHRLHGDTTCEIILSRIAAGACRTVRPLVARCEAGDALAGLLVGPGTAWASVREAMRDLDVPALAEETGEAVARTTSGPGVACVEPQRGRDGGDPLIEFTPCHRGLQLDAFHADGAAELIQQTWALVRRRFREGPHDRLGLFDEVVLESCAGEKLSILIDGEPAEVPTRATFTVAPCEVDLLATDHGF